MDSYLSPSFVESLEVIIKAFKGKKQQILGHVHGCVKEINKNPDIKIKNKCIPLNSGFWKRRFNAEYDGRGARFGIRIIYKRYPFGLVLLFIYDKSLCKNIDDKILKTINNQFDQSYLILASDYFNTVKG